MYSTPPPLSIQIGQRTGVLELIVYELLIHVLQKPFKDANITVGTYLSTNGKQRNLYIQILYLFTFLTINKWYELVYNNRIKSIGFSISYYFALVLLAVTILQWLLFCTGYANIYYIHARGQ